VFAVLRFIHALRLFAKERGFTSIVLLIFGRTIGATVSMFLLVDALLFRRLPFPAMGSPVGVAIRKPPQVQGSVCISQRMQHDLLVTRR
jgi:hypothetical protein